MKSVLRTAALLLAASLLIGLAVRPAQAQPSPGFRGEVEKALFWGDFEALRRLHAQARADRSPDADGISRLEHFSKGIGYLNRADVSARFTANWLALARRWVRERPEDPLAHALLLKAMSHAAWFERGDGYANTVSAEGQKAFEQQLRRAMDHVQAHPQAFEREVLAMEQMLVIGKGLGWPPEAFYRLMEAALKQDPQHLAISFAVLEPLLPKWQGNAEWVDRLVRDIVQRSQAEQGLAWYARLYHQAAASGFSQDLFTASRARWPLMKEGFQRLLRDHPGRLWPQRYATIACIARDQEAYREALDALIARGGEPLAADWAAFGGQRMIDGCQRWALAQ